MRILTVIHEFPPVGGGGGRAASDICNGLAARGHTVTVLTSRISGLPRDVLDAGVRVVRVAALRNEAFVAPFRSMLAYVVSGLWAGLSLIREDRPDVIHAHFAVPSGALAWLLSVLTGVPYVLTAHLGDVPGGVPEKTDAWFRWVKPFTYPIWKRARKIAAVSEHTRQLALKHYDVNIEVIPNGAKVRQLAPHSLSVNQRPHLVFAGRFVPQKNTLAIIAILAKLKDVEWTCSMFGDGIHFDDVKREIARQGMTSRFDLPGWISTGDVTDRFSRCDILFMPSITEGLPVVGVQALAKGLALVVSNIGGFRDLVDDGRNGFLIDTVDHERFVECLRRLVSDRDLLLQFRQSSLRKAQDFDIANVVERYDNIFRGVITGLAA